MIKNVRKAAIAGFFWTTTQNVGAQLSSFIVFILLARLLSPSDFGLIALAHVCIAFLALFTGAALTAAIVQRNEIDSKHLDTMFWTLLTMSTSLAVLAWFLAPVAARILSEPEVKPLIRWLSICLVLNAMQQVQMSLLRRELNFKSLALRSLVSEPIAGIIGIVLALSGFGVWSLVARTIASSAVQATVLWYKTDWRPQLSFSVPHFHQLFSFGINVTGANMLSFGRRHLDTLLIGYALGAGPLGYYTVAKRIVVLMTELIGGTIDKVAWPIFSRIQDDQIKVLTAFHRATQYISVIAFPVFTGLALLADSIVPNVFGEQWLRSAPLMQFFALIGLVHCISLFHETLMVGMGKPQLKFKLQGILLCVNLIVFFVTVKFGLLAVTAGYAVAAIALTPLWIIGVRKVVPLRVMPYLKEYSSAVIASAAMVLSVLFVKFAIPWNPASAGSLITLVAVGVVSYGLAVSIVDKALVSDGIKMLKSGRKSVR